VPAQVAEVTSGEDVIVTLTLVIAFTVQLTWLDGETLQPVPSDVLWLSTRLVPVTAAKLGILVDQVLQFVPLFVEYRYSSAVVPAPPEPAVMLTVSV